MTAKLNDTNWNATKTGHVHNNAENAANVKNLLDKTGCGMCLAKFKQMTLHLGTGMVHSCHHPTPHKIPLKELANNSNALFNTQHLKTARKEMLNDKRPSECDYCWRVEDDGNNSDRQFKSLESWALPDHDKVVALTGDEDIFPSYLEVSFSNACNMKCTYCGPEFSSKWVEELKKDGPIKLLEGTDEEAWSHGWQDLDTLNIPKKDHNPYVEAFWEWFPRALPHLKHYRITGGEPLMSKDTFKSMQWLIDNPNLDLEFSINSNFSIPEKLWQQFVDKLELMQYNTVKKITIFTSAESWGAQAEYARTGMDFELFQARTEQLLKMGNIRVVVMSAFNVFSATTFQSLLEWVLELKKKYNPNEEAQGLEENTGFNLRSGTTNYTQRKELNPDHSFIIGIDIPYLRHPTFLDAQILTDDIVEEFLLPTMNYMAENTAQGDWDAHQGFETHELEKLRRIVIHRLFFNRKNMDKPRPDIDLERAKFYEFVKQIDTRRDRDFLTTFPEMEEFYVECKKQAGLRGKPNEV
jgi:organic radical activating enzyme